MAKLVDLENFDLAFDLSVRAISSGQVVIYPTDTLYGIGCDATSKKAVGKIYKIKGREKGKPLSILFSDLEMLKKYCATTKKQQDILIKYLPGPYTFILPLLKPLPCSDNMTAGCRIPDHFFMRTISKTCNVPIVTTSANLSGKPPTNKFSKISKKLLSQVFLAINGGDCRFSQGSTVVDLSSMKVLRQGAGKWLD